MLKENGDKWIGRALIYLTIVSLSIALVYSWVSKSSSAAALLATKDAEIKSLQKEVEELKKTKADKYELENCMLKKRIQELESNQHN